MEEYLMGMNIHFDFRWLCGARPLSWKFVGSHFPKLSSEDLIASSIDRKQPEFQPAELAAGLLKFQSRFRKQQF